MNDAIKLEPIVVFLVEGQGVQTLLPRATEALGLGRKVFWYTYAQEKKEVLERDSLENREGLHFEIIADVHSVVLNHLKQPVLLKTATSKRIHDAMIQWLSSQDLLDLQVESFPWETA